jgi:hypothetical protein
MIISVRFRNFNFDMIWSATVARNTGEPGYEGVKRGQHAPFSFILVDGAMIVRGIRMATISWECANAIKKAQAELMSQEDRPEAINAEMASIFARYPNGIPEGFFHETCNLGD